MCGSNANVPPQVNTAKCWSIPVMVFAIISILNMPVGVVVWPCLITGVGGIVALVGSSILICCGPSDASAGAGKMMAGFILMLIGAICELGGAIAGLIVYFSVVAQARITCNIVDGETPNVLEQHCMNVITGIAGILIFPSVGISALTGVLALVAAIMSKQGHAAMLAGGGGVPKNGSPRPKRPKNIGASFRFMGESNAAGASSGNATQATTVHV